MTDRVDLEAIKARAASAARSGLADPANPNYFRTGSIVAIRGGLSDLRDYIMEPGDFAESELGDIATRLIKLAWPASQSGFNAADERERWAWAAWPADVDALVAELAVLRTQRDAALALIAPETEMALCVLGDRYFSESAIRAALGVQPEPAETKEQ